MNGRKDREGKPIRITRPTFFRRKAQLIAQVGEMWRSKREEHYVHEVQLCKERLTRQMQTAISHSQPDNASPIWGAIAAELAVSILKLEVEGIMSIHNGRLRQLEEKAGYIRYDEPRTPLPASNVDGMGQGEPTQTGAGSATEDPNRVA